MVSIQFTVRGNSTHICMYVYVYMSYTGVYVPIIIEKRSYESEKEWGKEGRRRVESVNDVNTMYS